MSTSRPTTSSEPVTGQTFEGLTQEQFRKPGALYEQCRFMRCSLPQGDLLGATFRECLFERCELSLVKLAGASLQQVRFIDCKLLGVQFSECRKLLLAMQFERCVMKLSVFSGLNLKGTMFTDCDLQEADFTGANLSGASFGNCELDRAVFHHTNLERADLRTAHNYSIPPESNRLRKARVSLHGLPGLVEHYGIEIE